MKRTRKNVCILQEAESKKRTTAAGSETILAFLMLLGILWAVQDIGYSMRCVEVGMTVGSIVILLRQFTEARENLAGKVRGILYLLGIVCFVLTVRWLAQGFLFMVSKTIYLWNLRFGTEAELLSTTEMAGTGSMILWGLAALWLASLILSQLKKKRLGSLLLLGILAFAFSAVLGQSRLWGSVFLLLPAMLGLFALYSSPGRSIGIRGGVILGMVCFMIAGISLLVSGYHRMDSIERWKYKVSRQIEKIRYGEDSLPQGNMQAASKLLDGKDDRLEVTMESPQELYLRGYVGADYQGTYWKTVSPESYQGDYDGMLKWLEKNGFEPVSQYGEYVQLTEKNTGNSTQHEPVQIKNTGAYRKYLYLPSAAINWNSGDAVAKKDWQVQSNSFFGSFHYGFDMIRGAVTADAVYPANWLENASDEEENQYLDAEAVYHSFTEDHYMDVDEELKATVQEFFFPDEKQLKEMDFAELTTQIRKALRSETEYTARPKSPSNGEDAIKWFLTDYKKGNAVYYASAAVMAYRMAGYPARYAEGYHLSADDAAALDESGQTIAELTTQNAHSWAEVYVAGVGWLPVEVVPGMYVETYSNQMMQGRAAYQVNVSPGDNGISTDQGGSESVGSGEVQKDDKPGLRLNYAAGVLVMILYFCFGIYLILELQRAIRIKWKKDRKRQKITEAGAVSYYVEEVERLIKIAGVRETKEQMQENWDLIQQKIPGITRDELKRAVDLVQKERFGGQSLKPYEDHTLEQLALRMEAKLYQNGTWYKKVLYRYLWVLKK